MSVRFRFVNMFDVKVKIAFPTLCQKYSTRCERPPIKLPDVGKHGPLAIAQCSLMGAVGLHAFDLDAVAQKPLSKNSVASAKIKDWAFHRGSESRIGINRVCVVWRPPHGLEDAVTGVAGCVSLVQQRGSFVQHRGNCSEAWLARKKITNCRKT